MEPIMVLEIDEDVKLVAEFMHAKYLDL